MMDIFSDFQFEILLCGNALIVGAAAIAVLRFQRLVIKNERFWNSPVGAQLAEKPDIDGVLCGFLDHRLRLMQDRIEALALSRPVVEKRVPASLPEAARKASPQPAQMPFEYAVRMAKQGAGVDDLMRACGLTRAEARLLHRVHGPQDRRGGDIAA